MKRSQPMRRTSRLRPRSKRNSRRHRDPALVREYREAFPGDELEPYLSP